MTYEARFGLTRQVGLALGLSLAFVALGVLLARDGERLGWLVAGFFGMCGAVILGVAVVGGTALRVDAGGIRLGAPFGRRAVDVPWGDVQAVVLFTQPLPRGNRMDYVGVVPAAAAADEGAATVLEQLGTRLTGAPPEVLRLSRAVTGWSLDEDRLAQAVRAHAPGVQLADLR